MSSSQRVSYLASARDNGINISCTSTQVERGDIIYFNSRKSVQLKILPVTALKSKLSDNAGVLTVIFTSTLLIVLVLFLLTLVGLRRRRHSKYSTDSVQVNSVDLLKPVWSVKDHESHSSESGRQKIK